MMETALLGNPFSKGPHFSRKKPHSAKSKSAKLPAHGILRLYQDSLANPSAIQPQPLAKEHPGDVLDPRADPGHRFVGVSMPKPLVCEGSRPDPDSTRWKEIVVSLVLRIPFKVAHSEFPQLWTCEETPVVHHSTPERHTLVVSDQGSSHIGRGWEARNGRRDRAMGRFFGSDSRNVGAASTTTVKEVKVSWTESPSRESHDLVGLAYLDLDG
ncbi:hypothetical protein SODALDRAFT_380862 [Sodiomyces alkalinus F11]|uniref:Uncharacterized protein n=1 Tax=Sodiomyces alkalinus (strain CBS 110278 / VKM F-3762 / F11) TaxID=1314773 RepID=A0A3N2PPW3_SODAK|nr:hypothetical protein SODALDRAFT_380862 [Sodiomyces alkalinus F11]ROT36552.1 hypothetical protein SODALDRAFT_380862 [Sodiomyces alkalinus F11]